MLKTTIKILLTLLLLNSFYAQTPVEDLKQSAVNHMKVGRYGEAIDLLNKVVTAQPRIAENYYLRGFCFEKRQRYENAVLDYRRAVNLMQSDRTATDEIKNNISTALNRAIGVWHPELKKKIAGYMREIAINPNNAFNYLEIGKCHRWLEQWIDAEEWYDKYLARDDNASPDEIIRYSEILAKNEHIKKGEIILKKYVDRYPDDWRLWSKYGWFTYWLGKNDVAIKAFQTALSFKPFFQEAMDGLDKAKRKPYVRDSDPKAFEKKEYPIDRFYRLVRTDPKDYKSRYSLVDELIKATRMEEAYQQLQYLSSNPVDSVKFRQKWTYVKNYRDSVYTTQVKSLETITQQNPNDKESLKKLAEYYEYLDNYDLAYDLVKNYFDKNPKESDLELKYRYARLSAWVKDYDKAKELIDEILAAAPTNLNYQLFKAQILIWTLQSPDEANQLVNNVLTERPNDIDALVAMGSLKIMANDFDSAQEFCDKAKKIDASNPSVIKLQSNIEFGILRAEEEKLLSILDVGRELFLDGQCKEALKYYENYMQQAEPTNMMLKEYADVNFCAQNYNKALEVYGKVLAQGYDYDVAIQRAKVFYMMGDSVNAVQSFKEIADQEPDDFESHIYLGDAYIKLQEFDSAHAVYDRLRAKSLDSSEVALLDMREKWFPVSGLNAILETFPNYIGFAPSAGYYSDNLGFRTFNYGGRLELGVNSFMAVGASFVRTHISNSTNTRVFTSMKGHLFLTLTKYLRVGFGFGKLNTKDKPAQNEIEAYFNYEIKDYMGISGNFLRTDEAALLYSPNLVDLKTRGLMNYYKLKAYYVYLNMVKFTGSFQYMEIPGDKINNQGNDLVLSAGYYITPNLLAGYEFYYSNFRYPTKLYYSPQNFESHSLFAEWAMLHHDQSVITVGGKLGTIPKTKSTLRELFAKFMYIPHDGFSVETLISLGSTYREDSSYNYMSGRVSIYWSL